jgi:hypothetical protein
MATFGALSVLCTGVAQAQTSAPQPSEPARRTVPLRRPVSERPHSLAELSFGVLALPFAPLSEAYRGGDIFLGRIGRGDATALLGINVLVHNGGLFAFGAALHFATSPTTDDQYGGSSRLARSHARSYFTLEGTGRFIPLRIGDFEGWVGPAAGVAILADTFSTNAGIKKPTIFGVQAYTIGTQGLLLGLRTGLTWNISERFSAGLAFAADGWFLPKQATCNPIGDCATLTGVALALQGALSVGYRLAL